MPADSGRLDLFGFGAGTLDEGRIGAGIEYLHHIRPGWSAFAAGEVARQWGGSHAGLAWEGRVGTRVVWR